MENGKNRTYMNIGLLMVLLLSVVFMLYAGFKLRESIAEKRRGISELQVNYTQLENLKADHDKKVKDIEEILSSLPKEYIDIGTLAYKIENAADSANIKAVLEFDKEITEENGYTSLNVMVSTKGGYQDFSKFLDNVLLLPYNIEIKNIIYENVKNEITQKTTFTIYMKK